VQYQVRAKLERVLVNRRGKGVIHDHQRPRFFSCPSQAGQVQYLNGGIGGALQVKDTAPAGDFGLDGLVIGGVTEGNINLKRGRNLVKITLVSP
jgi:hypothetical protein